MEKTYRIEKCDSKVQWDEFILANNGHPLQLWGWGDLKAGYNWQVERFFVVEDDDSIGAVQLLIRTLPKPFAPLLYVPRGPVIVSNDHAAAVYEQLIAYVKRAHKAVAITVEPDSDQPPVGEEWRESSNSILLAETVVISLDRADGSILAEMSPDTRSHIRQAAGNNLTIKKLGNPDDITACLDIYKQTAQREGFSLHKDQYYYDLHDKMGDHSVIFGCFDDGNSLVAFVWLVVTESVAFELYDGVSQRGQELSAEYAVKWEAIRRIKQWGVSRYDLNGLLGGEHNAFKSGFAPQTYRSAGTFDWKLSPAYGLWYRLLRIRSRLRSKKHRRDDTIS